jgi:hypothetical protein
VEGVEDDGDSERRDGVREGCEDVVTAEDGCGGADVRDCARGRDGRGPCSCADCSVAFSDADREPSSSPWTLSGLSSQEPVPSRSRSSNERSMSGRSVSCAGVTTAASLSIFVISSVAIFAVS